MMEVIFILLLVNLLVEFMILGVLHQKFQCGWEDDQYLPFKFIAVLSVIVIFIAAFKS